MATALNEPQADDLLEPSQAQLQSWLDAALTVAGQQPGATAAVRILSVAEMGELNQRFRGRTGPTNSLAFPVETEIPDSVEAGDFLGDIALCGQIIGEQASEAGIQAVEHWAHLTIHACLHLLGHDHQNPEAARQMEALESRAMAALGLPDPWQDNPHRPEQNAGQ